MLARPKAVTLFKAPLFTLRQAPATQQWANVSNTLDVLHRGREGVRLIQVGTALFPVLQFLKVDPESVVTLFLEDDGNRFLFGVVVDDEELFDLWHYTPDQVPMAIYQV